MDAINEVYGKGSAPVGISPSVGQEVCLDFVRGLYKGMGPPPDNISAAEAFTELCGARDGYSGESPAPRASYHREHVSLPAGGAPPANGSRLLSGGDRLAWEDWRHVIRRDSAEAQDVRRECGVHQPYLDRKLARSPKVYAQFIADLVRAGKQCRRR